MNESEQIKDLRRGFQILRQSSNELGITQLQQQASVYVSRVLELVCDGIKHRVVADAFAKLKLDAATYNGTVIGGYGNNFVVNIAELRRRMNEGKERFEASYEKIDDVGETMEAAPESMGVEQMGAITADKNAMSDVKQLRRAFSSNLRRHDPGRQ